MKPTTSTPVRIDADLYEAARVEAHRSSRSVAQQIDHWARLGRSVSLPATAARRRVEAAIAGDLALDALSREERLIANAAIDTAIEERARYVAFGDQLLGEGVTVVATDDDGRLVEYRPDGTSQVVEDRLDGTSQVVEDRLDGTSQVVEDRLDGTSQVVEDRLDGTSQAVE